MPSDKIAKHFKLGKHEKEILKLIGLGLLIVGTIAAPNLPAALQPIMKRRGEKYLKTSLKKFEANNIIFLGGDKVELTKRGRELLTLVQIDEIEIPRPAEWDHIWRLVAYDIPDRYKKERNFFHRTLTRLGFVKVQESLLTFPYECQEEIAVLAQSLRLAPFVVLMTTDHLPNQKEAERVFGLNES